MQKNCDNCKEQFNITNEDTAYLSRINVPPSDSCPTCREQRRMAFRNEKTLYHRTCNLCKKSIISIYSSNKPYPVYCQDCFWSDNWDPMEYGMKFDFSRPFFEQFNDLLRKTPRLAIINKQSQNSDYCNYSFGNKNCYLTFGDHYEEDSMYGRYSTKNKDCLDFLYLYESELCYECITSKKCYNSIHLINSQDCQDCFFSTDLQGCKDCLFSSNLRHKQYYILNEHHTKEEYLKKLQILKLHTYSGFSKAKKYFLNDFRKKFPFRAIYQTNCQNCEGSNHKNCKNIRSGFDCADCEDCAYIVQSDQTYDSMDVTCMGYDRSEVCYQTIGCTGIFNCIACDSCWHNNDLHYCNLAFSSKDSFGCVSIKRKQNCILNTQYTKEQYEEMLPRIIEHMKKTGEWGQFFPMSISPFGYNETIANEYHSLTKDQALAMGAK
ncbi:hypothetical protein KJ835_04280, partial [Patescibacteria group bacterium]|nr:hypothetical protein [Patescibacteria group bacterium]